ncbi:serine/threonine protein kinase [Marinobacteraceae bacterium S3BR75-40.1]
MSSGHPYDALTPDLILDSVEAAGFTVNGRLFPLNSYENRVYQVGLEDQTPVIAKFYRPERWTEAQIIEEHTFTHELVAGEIPVVASLPLANGDFLGRAGDFLFALFPQRGGQAPDVSVPDTLYRLGQWLGRLHAIGAKRAFEYRPSLDILATLTSSRDLLLEKGFIPPSLEEAYTSLLRDLIELTGQRIADAGEVDWIRLHGDCHMGNILVREDQMLLVDLDDARQGPAMQDLWLLLNGERPEREAQFSELLEGYEQFYDLNLRERYLIEPLRTARVVGHAAWLGKRWDDPTFPQHFPWFGQERFWSDHILMLREQLAALQEPPIGLPGQG